MLGCKFVIAIIYFFKQKPPYEVHISDWSSYVCSAVLADAANRGRPAVIVVRLNKTIRGRIRHGQISLRCIGGRHRGWTRTFSGGIRRHQRRTTGAGADRQRSPGRCAERSEEHTSELQSLMRISYAVFCLKQKKNNPQKPH